MLKTNNAQFASVYVTECTRGSTVVAAERCVNGLWDRKILLNINRLPALIAHPKVQHAYCFTLYGRTYALDMAYNRALQPFVLGAEDQALAAA